MVFENVNKIESFGILSEFNDRQTIFENTVRRELEQYVVRQMADQAGKHIATRHRNSCGSTGIGQLSRNKRHRLRHIASVQTFRLTENQRADRASIANATYYRKLRRNLIKLIRNTTLPSRHMYRIESQTIDSGAPLMRIPNTALR